MIEESPGNPFLESEIGYAIKPALFNNMDNTMFEDANSICAELALPVYVESKNL